MKLLRIEGPDFVVGLVLGNDDKVRHVPRLVNYMQGWSLQHVKQYAKWKRWSIMTEETPDNWRAL